MTMRQIFFYLSGAVILMAMMSGSAPAFCPMCKTAIEGANAAQEIAGSLNLASLILLAPPVLIFAALFGLFYRLRHAGGPQAPLDEEMDERSNVAL